MTHESFWLGAAFGVAVSSAAFRLGMFIRYRRERRRQLARLRPPYIWDR